MAIVYDQSVPVQPQPHTGFFGWIENNPVPAIFIGIILAVGVGYVIYQLRGGAGASGATTPSTSGTGTTSGVNSSGQQVVYVPTSNTFLDYANYVNNNSPVSTSTSTTNVVNNPPPQPPPPPPPPPQPQWSLTGSEPNSLWDNPYIVQQGDTLDSIASKIMSHGWHDRHMRDVLKSGNYTPDTPLTAADLYSHNKANIDALNTEYGSTNGQQVYPGQALWIPIQLQY